MRIKIQDYQLKIKVEEREIKNLRGRLKVDKETMVFLLTNYETEDEVTDSEISAYINRLKDEIKMAKQKILKYETKIDVIKNKSLDKCIKQKFEEDDNPFEDYDPDFSITANLFLEPLKRHLDKHSLKLLFDDMHDTFQIIKKENYYSLIPINRTVILNGEKLPME